MSVQREVKRVVIEDDGARLPKVVVRADTGKKFSDGNAILAKIEVYRTNVFAGATKDKPYGSPTEEQCYRLSLGKFPKVGLTASGVKDLIEGLKLVLKEFPLSGA